MNNNTSLRKALEFIRGIAIPTKKVTALLVVVLFFCPMFFVSCQAPLAGNIKVNVSGMDVATGFTVTSDGEKVNALMGKIGGQEISTDSIIEGNPVTFSLLGIAVAMLVSSLLIKKASVRKLNYAQIGLAVVHIIGWIIFMSQVRAYVQSELGSTVEFHTTFAYTLNILAGILFGLAAIACAIEMKPTNDGTYISPTVDKSSTLSSVISTEVSSGTSYIEPDVKPVERVVPEEKTAIADLSPKATILEPSMPEMESSVRINMGSKRHEGNTAEPLDSETRKKSEVSGRFHRPTGL